MHILLDEYVDKYVNLPVRLAFPNYEVLTVAEDGHAGADEARRAITFSVEKKLAERDPVSSGLEQ